MCPFLQAQWTGMHILEVTIGPKVLWSFKETDEYGWMNGGVVVEEWWFSGYWMRVEFGSGLGSWVGPFLIFMFEAQIFTVLFAALAIFKVKPYLSLSSAILNAFTTFCMWFVSYAVDLDYAKTFQAGFWLTFCSATLFFAAFLESWRQHRRRQRAKTTETPRPPLSSNQKS